MKQNALALFVCLLASTLCPGSGMAEESFFQRFNPMRFFRAPAAESNIEQRQAALRSKLEERGIATELIDQRIEHVADASRPGERPSFANGKPKAKSAQELRTQMEARGWDSEKIDQRITRLTEMRETANSRRPDGARPSDETIQSRLTHRGLDASEIESRISRRNDDSNLPRSAGMSQREPRASRGRR